MLQEDSASVPKYALKEEYLNLCNPFQFSEDIRIMQILVDVRIQSFLILRNLAHGNPIIQLESARFLEYTKLGSNHFYQVPCLCSVYIFMY